MNYIPSSLLALWRAARPSTDRPALPAFKAPAAFIDEIREDQLSRASSYESEVDDECECTSFDLPEGWDNDLTDAAFAKGAALLRGHVGIDELTEVKVLREPPLVRAERARPATPVSTGLLGALDAATAAFQPRLAIAFSAVLIVGVAIVLTHHRLATVQYSAIAKATPEQQGPPPERAMPAPRSQGAQVALAQPSSPSNPPTVRESASVQGPKDVAAPTLPRASIASPAPGSSPDAVAVLPMPRQGTVARKGTTSPTVVTVPRAQMPEGEPVLAMKDSAPAGALPVAPVPPAPEDVARARLAEIMVRELVAGVMPRVSSPGSQAVPAVEPLQEAACAASNAACLTDALAMAITASERRKQVTAALAADLTAANAALEACDASDMACLDAALPKALKAREQFEQKLALARIQLAAARAVLERSNGRVPASDLAVLMMQTNAAMASQERRLIDHATDVVAAPVESKVIDPLRPEVRLDLNDRAAQADLLARVRAGMAIADLQNERVEKWQQWYASRPDYVQRMTERGGRYLFHIVEEVNKRGLPTELALLPFIESAFNPQAMSSAKASGMWQFTPGTGRDFDMRQNLFRDDRRDVLASTRAALHYLENLHRMFGDWQLALAAYNWGQGNVQKAIARNVQAGLPTDYNSLRMPEETRNYYPKLQAVKNILANPQAFGLTLPVLLNHPYFVSVGIDRDIDVDLAARLAGLPLDEFKQLNPQMNKPVILAAGKPQLLLPYDNANRFVRAVAQHRGNLASWTAWIAPRTVEPAEAARQVGMDEAQLHAVNNIPRGMLVKAGSTLLVPRSVNHTEDVAEHIADHATLALAPDVLPLKRISFKAGRKGDTVAAIARRYRVRPEQVAQWNDTTDGARFKPGQVVVVMVPDNANTLLAGSGRHHGGGSQVARAERGKQVVEERRDR